VQYLLVALQLPEAIPAGTPACRPIFALSTPMGFMAALSLPRSPRRTRMAFLLSMLFLQTLSPRS
jgi:hypothetical protein